MRVHPGCAGEDALGELGPSAEERVRGDLIGGVLLVTEDGQVQQVEDRMRDLMEEDEDERAHDRVIDREALRGRARRLVDQLVDQLVAQAHAVISGVVRRVRLAALHRPQRQRAREPEEGEALGHLLEQLPPA